MDRTILHCDCNGFFASVECVIRPELKNMPMAVGGSSETRHGIILAKNELAKKYDIQTAEPIGRAMEKCPELVIVPPHHELYKKYSDMINEIYREYTDLAEKFGIDETWLDVTGSVRLFGDGEKIANEIRERIKNEIGLTVSVGVSFNKVFAKLGSDYKKPDATTVISRENFKSFVYPMSVDTLLFAGRKTVDVLKKLYINTIGDLAEADFYVMKKRLGKNGEMLWRYARGEDNEPVRSAYESEEVKSVGKGMTFPKDLRDADELRREIYLLSDNIASRLRKYNKKCLTVQVHLKNPSFKVVSKQKPLPEGTYITNRIADCAYELFSEMKEAVPVVRALTVTAVNLIDANASEQMRLMDSYNEKNDSMEKLENTVDKLRSVYGEKIIFRGGKLSD